MIEIVEDFKNALRLFSTRTWRITGLEKESGQQMSIVYCGSDKHIEYISGKVFGANVDNKELIGRRPIMTIDRMLREWDCSIAIVTAPRWALSVIRKHGDLCIPWWIDCEIDCRSALGGGHTKSLQNDLRKIRKNELYFEKANQVEDFVSSMTGYTRQLFIVRMEKQRCPAHSKRERINCAPARQNSFSFSGMEKCWVAYCSICVEKCQRSAISVYLMVIES